MRPARAPFAPRPRRAKAMRIVICDVVWRDMASGVAAVVVAGGRGLRAGGDVPKQYRQVFGEPVIRPSLAALANHAGVSLVQPVIHPDDATLFRAASAGISVLPPVHGGA